MDQHSFTVLAHGQPVQFVLGPGAPVDRLKSLYEPYLTRREARLRVLAQFGANAPAEADEPDAPGRLVFRTTRIRGSVDLASGQGEVFIREPDAVEAFGLFFRILYTALARAAGKSFIHASAAVRGDGAVLFVGPSGAGKTTAIRLFGGRIIHDDTVFLGGEDDGPLVETAPFMGDESFIYGPMEHFRVTKIFLLYKDARAFLAPASKASALGRLLTLPWEETGSGWTRDIEGYLAAGMRRCKHLVEMADCYELHFTRERLPEESMRN